MNAPNEQTPDPTPVAVTPAASASAPFDKLRAAADKGAPVAPAIGRGSSY